MQLLSGEREAMVCGVNAAQNEKEMVSLMEVFFNRELREMLLASVLHLCFTSAQIPKELASG